MWKSFNLAWIRDNACHKYLPCIFLLFYYIFFSLRIFGYLSLNAYYVSPWFYNIWYNLKNYGGLLFFLYERWKYWNLRKFSYLQLNQYLVVLGWDLGMLGFKSILFPLLQAVLRAESMSSFISAFPTAYGLFPDTEWACTLMKYLTKVRKYIKNSNVALLYLGQFTSLGTESFHV